MSETPRRCLDCKGELQEILIIDRGGSIERGGFQYAAANAERGVWTGKYPVAGNVLSYLCQNCGAVRLFAEQEDSGNILPG